ncbi:MAG: hypothetical protein J6S67_03400 [Methanobrevibacter sp.]|nr:hypothetical protein [Methanobrevibacter sp.]
MKLNKCYVADFETTTDEDDCRVWAYSICNVDDYNIFLYGNSLDAFMEFCANQKDNYKIWFHNLKFDSAFILFWLHENGFTWIADKKERRDKTYTTLITDMGQFYNITIYFECGKKHTNKVEIYDSLKIFPNFSVERIAEGFNLPIKKLDIDYRKYRPIGHELTQEEIDYIRNDVEIVARALKEMFSRGLTKMTIASDAMNNFKDNFITGFKRKFPVLPPEVDSDIRKSYKGGFTYVNECYKEKQVGHGITLDVNSLYPSCMCTPYALPYGRPKEYEGKYQFDEAYPLYVQSFICSFEIKQGKIPSIQIKNTLSFIPNEYIKSSGGIRVALTLTKPDFELFQEQYDIYDIEYVGGWKFKSIIGIFDDYINYWTEQKIKAGKEKNKSLRQIAKLMLNSLYGRFGLSGTARQKMPYFTADNQLKFPLLPKETRDTVYVAVAAFVTSYGRSKTIRTSQAIRDFTLKKYGEDRYYYSDTDSCHANLSAEDLEELKETVEIDDFKLGYWAKEAEFTRAIYIRQKCYIEEIDGRIETTVAGLPKYLAPLITFDNFKKGFTTEGLTLEQMIQIASNNGATKEEIKKLHHKFRYQYVHGGVILADTDFTII